MIKSMKINKDLLIHLGLKITIIEQTRIIVIVIVFAIMQGKRAAQCEQS